MVHNWKPVPLDENLLTKAIDGLIGIEELTDYEIDKFQSKGNKRKGDKHQRKNQTDEIPAKKVKIDYDKAEKKSKKDKTNKINVKDSKKELKKVTKKNNTENGKKVKDLNKSKEELKKVTKKISTKNVEKVKDSTNLILDENILDSMSSWSHLNLRDEIIKALYDKGFEEPTEIQKESLPAALLGRRDILGAAETGSGKTLAFGIPIVNGILKIQDNTAGEEDEVIGHEEELERVWEDPTVNIGCIKVIESDSLGRAPILSGSNLYALVLTPTRELAVQVRNHIIDICKYTNIKVALIVGGLSQQKQERILRCKPEIIVATPGRLWDLIQDGNAHLDGVERIRYLAVDETDRMLEKGHFEELDQLLGKLNNNETLRKRRQNFIFSATLTVVHDPPKYTGGKKKKKLKKLTSKEKVHELMTKIGVTDAKVVDITTKNIIVDTIQENKIVCKFEEKDYYLYYFLLQHRARTLIFTNSISCVKRLANILIILGVRPLPLHANMEQRQRLKNLDRFRQVDNSILLATDVAARGLDIPGVKHVIHYQVHNTVEAYVHRSGRTARAKSDGTTLILVEPGEHKSYVKILYSLGKDRDIPELPVDLSLMDDVKKRVHLARDIDQLSLSAKKQTSKRSWFEKAAMEMDIEIDEDVLPKKIDDQVYSQVNRDLKRKRKDLQNLLQRPLVPANFSGKYPNINANAPTAGTFVLKRREPVPV